MFVYFSRNFSFSFKLYINLWLKYKCNATNMHIKLKCNFVQLSTECVLLSFWSNVIFSVAIIQWINLVCTHDFTCIHYLRDMYYISGFPQILYVLCPSHYVLSCISLFLFCLLNYQYYCFMGSLGNGWLFCLPALCNVVILFSFPPRIHFWLKNNFNSHL